LAARTARLPDETQKQESLRNYSRGSWGRGVKAEFLSVPAGMETVSESCCDQTFVGSPAPWNLSGSTFWIFSSGGLIPPWMRAGRRNTSIAGKVQSQKHCPERGEGCSGNPLIGVTVAAVPMHSFRCCTKKQLPKATQLALNRRGPEGVSSGTFRLRLLTD